VVVDVSNVGPIDGSVVEITSDRPLPDAGITVRTNFDMLASEAEYQAFLNEHPGPNSFGILQISFAGLPLELAGGQSRRLAIQGTIVYEADKGVGPAEFRATVLERTYVANVTFKLADGTASTLGVDVPRPYYSVPVSTIPASYETCPDGWSKMWWEDS
jgi:hypothetical protein